MSSETSTGPADSASGDAEHPSEGSGGGADPTARPAACPGRDEAPRPEPGGGPGAGAEAEPDDLRLERTSDPTEPSDTWGGLADVVAEDVLRTAHRLEAAGVRVEPPVGHPASLALCVVEAVWAPRVRPTAVAGVVARVREHLASTAGPGDGLDAPALLASFTAAGDDEAWAAALATRHRTASTAGAPLKATAVREAAEALVDVGVVTTADLLAVLRDHRAAAAQAQTHARARVALTPWPPVEAPAAPSSERWEAVRAAWCAAAGQSSGRSWHRLLLLAGAEQVVPDDDVRRFVSRLVRSLLAGGQPARAGSRPGALEAAALLEAAAAVLGAPAREVDHVVWRSELQVGARRPGDGRAG
ncbi:hypothetical protein WDZ16_00720 [Pseudokineococcus marinus]|uniref:Uncharacterized protein n=1 Tax=Pseudokineococcus marinus TaxID=351215 RepID=A0A849BNZ7_9ACTN|nr:hypothetical protein [Pseudokineococcus marinus]NNH23053.1 hypothetical protein [Pseudokineococcus marinus]